LSGKNDVIEFVDALIVGKGRSGCGADTGDRAWPASSIGKVDSRTRKRSGLFENHTVARRRVIVVPLQDWAKTRGRTQHPFPIIRLDGTTDRRTPQLLDRCEQRRVGLLERAPAGDDRGAAAWSELEELSAAWPSTSLATITTGS
jgi:hypothetical protein